MELLRRVSFRAKKPGGQKIGWITIGILSGADKFGRFRPTFTGH